MQTLQPDRVRAINTALERADDVRGKQSGTLASELDGLAAALEHEADAARNPDARRLRALSATVRTQAAKAR
jgi:hypothetical protein